MSNYTDVAAGVAEAVAEAGETLTITRTTYTTDPNNPTQPPQANNAVYTCTGYIGPVSQFNRESMQLETTTDCYIDPLSVLDDQSQPVNSTSALAFVTTEGDIVENAAGDQYVMTKKLHPIIEGKIALFWHRGVA